MDLKTQLQMKLKELEGMRMQLAQLDEQKQKLTVVALETQGACKMLADMVNASAPKAPAPTTTPTPAPAVTEVTEEAATPKKSKKK